MSENHICFKTSFLSDSGTFVKDKAAFAYKQLDQYAFWIIADGLEIHEEKESAQLVVEKIFEDLINQPTMQRSVLRKYLTDAHQLLIKEGHNHSLKTSLVLVVTDYSSIIWAVCGNSRMYHFRAKEFNFRSQDQSTAEQMVKSGNLSVYGAKATDQEEHHGLTNYLGIDAEFAPFISKKFKLQDGDVMLLCNAGFWGKVRYDEMSHVLKLVQEPTDFLTYLKEILLLKEMFLNNYIIGAIFTKKVLHEPVKLSNKKKPSIIIATLVGLLFFGGTVWGLKTMEENRLKKEAQAAKIYEASQKQSVLSVEKHGDELMASGNYSGAVAEYNRAINLLATIPYAEKEPVIKKKIQIAMMMNDGNSYFEAKKYKLALEKYLAAFQEDTESYFKNILQMKIDHTKATIVKTTHTARAVSATPSKLKMIPLTKTQTDKLTLTGNKGTKPKATADSTTANTELASLQTQARQQERSGDSQCANEQYKEAYASYKKALKLYKKLKMNDRVQIIKDKMKETKAKRRRSFEGD